MPKWNGKDCLLYMDGNDISGQANAVSLNVGNAVSDSSAFGDDWDTDTEGTANWNGSYTGWYDLDGSDEVTDKVLGMVGGGLFIVLCYPHAQVASEGYFYGTAHLTGMPVTVTRGQTVVQSASWKGSGQLQALTYS